ncbi:MAG: type II toxin-antitoxin system RelB/DinJ family antitoxin [Candidatus Sungbacteria bacterium]|nr:type II toxin-antitoxin system RelB/DinJ family antitoxin [Candidatus Sungbacteria bacterium]
MEKTLLNVKTDKKLKQEAQMAARELGLPLGTIINAYLKEFIREKRVIFSVPPMPNKRTQKLLRQIIKDIKSDKNARRPFAYEEALRHLDRL